MFTGIVKTSKIKNARPTSKGLVLEVLNNFKKTKIGESIAVNGVCSTAIKNGKNIIFEYMPESLRVSNLGFLKKDDTVNVERSMRLSDRLDGHIVLGHIDATRKIISIRKEGNSKVFKIHIQDKKYRKFLAHKGSVALEGISLTVAKILKNAFVVKITPYTLEHTNLRYKKAGDLVNIEFDILAKYANKK